MPTSLRARIITAMTKHGKFDDHYCRLMMMADYKPTVMEVMNVFPHYIIPLAQSYQRFDLCLFLDASFVWARHLYDLTINLPLSKELLRPTSMVDGLWAKDAARIAAK